MSKAESYTVLQNLSKDMDVTLSKFKKWKSERKKTPLDKSFIFYQISKSISVTSAKKVLPVQLPNELFPSLPFVYITRNFYKTWFFQIQNSNSKRSPYRIWTSVNFWCISHTTWLAFTLQSAQKNEENRKNEKNTCKK